MGTSSRLRQEKIQGLALAARPIMTASQPVCSSMRRASAGVQTSPLPITGSFSNARFNSAIGCHWAGLWKEILPVRPCRASALAPFSAARLAISRKFSDALSQPSLILTVTGTLTARETAATASRTNWGSRIIPTPAPRPATLLAAQPMLISMMSGWNSSSMRAAHSAMRTASLSRSCAAKGRSSWRARRRFFW